MKDKFVLHYQKIKPLDIHSLAKQYVAESADDENYDYNPYVITGIQSYNPLYSEFFELNESNYNKVSLNHKYQLEGTQIPNLYHNRGFHMKCSPLLDPLHYLVGKYDYGDPCLTQLPSVSNLDQCFPKIRSIHNASYIDYFFSYLSSQVLHHHNVFNGIDYYGSYLGVQEVFKATITDDLEYFYSSPKFMENLGKHFHVGGGKGNLDDFSNVGSRSNKCKIQISGEDEMIDVEEIGVAITDRENTPLSEEEEIVYEKSPDSRKSSVSTSSSNDSGELNYSSTEEEEDDEKEEDDSEYTTDSSSYSESDEPEVYAYIKHFPMQLICLEKCDGTLDKLLVDDEIDKERGLACMMQIIMTLLIYQKAFLFTHNDLHTNNIMYVETDHEYVYYRYEGKTYKVPTYGKIFKLIDFGRAIYRFQGKILCSDSFASGGDAHTQYNCEPFLSESKPRIDPNPSFDLCRLGCAIYDFVIDDEREKRDAFQETIWRWCQDDNGKNVLYKRNGEERYPNFKLYKMIARNVHKHTPEAQLSIPAFEQFRMNAKKAAKLEDSAFVVDIDAIPCYA